MFDKIAQRFWTREARPKGEERSDESIAVGAPNLRKVVVEIGRPGPHSLGPADLRSIVVPGTIHALTMNPNRRVRNRPSARRNAMRTEARKDKRWAAKCR